MDNGTLLAQSPDNNLSKALADRQVPVIKLCRLIEVRNRYPNCVVS